MSNIKQTTSNKELFIRSELLNQKTTSDKIRFLYSKGISKSEISNILFIRYQHVRNVLNYQLKK